MTFKPAIWYPIASLLSALNLAAVWFAAQPAEPWHATSHAALAVAFGLWAMRLRQRRGASGVQQSQLGAAEENARELELLDAEVSVLRKELSDTQERLDFAERMLARPDPRRAGPDA